MDAECWRRVEGWPYEVSNLGRIRNPKSGNITVGSANSTGYKFAILSNCGRKKTFKVHRLVAHAFIGPCPDGMEVNHKDGNRCNNELSNLEYVTSSRNTLHAIERGSFPVGSRRWNSKLDEHKVRMIRASVRHPSDLAQEHGVTEATIYKVLNRQNWRHV